MQNNNISPNDSKFHNSYSKLEEEFEVITHLSNILGLAFWDSATMLGSGSALSRQKEISTMSSVIHRFIKSDNVKELIARSESELDKMNDIQKMNLKLIKKQHQNAVVVSDELQNHFTTATGECEFIWREAKSSNNFTKLEPYLDKVFDLTREIAKIKSDVFQKPSYDILIDSFDSDRTEEEIKLVYNGLKNTLPDLVRKVIDKQAMESPPLPLDVVSEETQKNIGLSIMKKMGFDFTKGRLDKSAHPFCSGSNDDIRITTRYDLKNFLSSLFGVIHETGHALYQQNLPNQYRNQPVGSASGMAFHESQSLIMEMQAGTSKAFVSFLAKMLRDEFGFVGPAYSDSNLYKLMTSVKASFIRVDADEVTYPLHVILRFEIEQEILKGMKAKELPALWNSKMEQYLGIIPRSDSEGCMQDIHWPSGSIGYFPSYVNGAIIASMMMKAAKTKYDIDSDLKIGDFQNINLYLNDNFRKYGSAKTSKELLYSATGEDEINQDIFIDYLKTKYLEPTI